MVFTKITVSQFFIISIIRCVCRLTLIAAMYYLALFVGIPMVYLFLFQSHHTWGARRRLPHLSDQRCAEAEQGEEPGEGKAEAAAAAAAAGTAAAEGRQGRHWRGRRCRHQTSAVPGRKKILFIVFLPVAKPSGLRAVGVVLVVVGGTSLMSSDFFVFAVYIKPPNQRFLFDVGSLAS